MAELAELAEAKAELAEAEAELAEAVAELAEAKADLAELAEAELAEAVAELTELAEVEIRQCVTRCQDEREIVRQISKRETNGSAPATRNGSHTRTNLKVQLPGVPVSDPGQVEASWLEEQTPIPHQWRQSNSESDNFSGGSPKRFNRSK